MKRLQMLALLTLPACTPLKEGECTALKGKSGTMYLKVDRIENNHFYVSYRFPGDSTWNSVGLQFNNVELRFMNRARCPQE